MATDIGEVVREEGLAFWEGEPDDPWSVVQEVNTWQWGTVATTPYDRLEMLLKAVTLDKFVLSANMVRGWKSVREFLGLVKAIYEDRLDGRWRWDGQGSPWKDAGVVEEFMSECMDVAKRSGVFYPPGWLLVLSGIRAALPHA